MEAQNTSPYKITVQSDILPDWTQAADQGELQIQLLVPATW